MDMARCASAGEVKVTHASPVARPSRWPSTMPLLLVRVRGRGTGEGRGGGRVRVNPNLTLTLTLTLTC